MSAGDGPAQQGLHRLVRFVGPTSVLLPLLTVCISVIIARTLGPEGRGQYGVIVATVSILPSLAGLGLEYAVRYWSARGQVDAYALLRTATLLALAIGLFVGVGAVLWWRLDGPAWLIPGGLPGVAAGALGFVLFATVMRGFWSSYLVGMERYGYGTWGVVAGTALQAAVLAGVAGFATMSLGAAVLSLAAQAAFSLLVFLPLSWSDVPGALKARVLPRRELRAMLRYASWQYMSMIAIQTNMRLNVFLLAALSSFHETGLYTAVIGPATFLQLLASPLNMVLGPRTTLRRDDAGFAARVAGALRVLVVITALPAVGAGVVAPWALPFVFGDEFAGAVEPFWWLLPGTVAFALFKVLIQFQTGSGRPEWNTWSAGSGALVALVANLLLIPPYGAVGAAVATTLAYVTSAVVAVVGFLQVGGLGPGDLLRFRRGDWEPIRRVIGLGSSPPPRP